MSNDVSELKKVTAQVNSACGLTWNLDPTENATQSSWPKAKLLHLSQNGHVCSSGRIRQLNPDRYSCWKLTIEINCCPSLAETTYWMLLCSFLQLGAKGWTILLHCVIHTTTGRHLNTWSDYLKTRNSGDDVLIARQSKVIKHFITHHQHRVLCTKSTLKVTLY